MQARNGSTALDIARTHRRLQVQMMLENYAQWEVLACTVAAAALQSYMHKKCLLLPSPRNAGSRMHGGAVKLTAAAAGLQPGQRVTLLCSGGCVLLLIMRFAQHREAVLARSARKQMPLVARRCIGGALARRLLRQHALRTLADAAWGHACEEDKEGGDKEMCYGD